MTAAIVPRPDRLVCIAIASWYTGQWELSTEKLHFQPINLSIMTPKENADRRQPSRKPVAAVSHHLLEFRTFEANEKWRDGRGLAHWFPTETV